MYINFSDLPGQNNLFLDYLYEYDNVKEFYKYNFRDKDQFQKIFKKISESDRFDPTLLRKILLSQNTGLTTSNKTKKNIELLSKDSTLAVVTGQQLGMIGGPMYTLYKIITSLKLSKNLNDRYDDYSFVPVFWMEGDDHDFNEIRSINVIGNENTRLKILVTKIRSILMIQKEVWENLSLMIRWMIFLISWIGV